jgi:hypothetical protein
MRSYAGDSRRTHLRKKAGPLKGSRQFRIRLLQVKQETCISSQANQDTTSVKVFAFSSVK